MWLHSHSESPVTAGHCHQLMVVLSFFPWAGNNAPVKDASVGLVCQGQPKKPIESFSVTLSSRNSNSTSACGHHLVKPIKGGLQVMGMLPPP